jgi:hypothetical protein
MNDRLAELKAEAARLNARIAELEGDNNRVTPPPIREEPGVRIIAVLDERTDLPSLKEMERLYSVVKNLAPWPLNDKYDDTRPFRGFCACFRWIANKGRVEAPNPKFALSFWLDNCKTWLRERNGMVNDVSANELIMATFAVGDVKYVAANAQIGTVWELALAEYVGRPASPNAWQMVMKNGASAILPPSSPARRDMPLSPVRIYTGV